MSSQIEAADSLNKFCIKVYSKLAKPQENLFYSPTSIYVALAMTYAGARDSTAREVEQVMNWSTPESVHERTREIQECWLASDASGIELKLANRLWMQEGFVILKEFTDILKRCYQAEMGIEDFRCKSEQARRAINRWVEDKTNSKIKDLLQEDVLTPNTRLVLTNAVYFKGSWQGRFVESDTYDWDFNITNTESTKVKLMNKTAHFPYAKNESLSCQVLKLPYREGKVAMMVMLPDEVDGLPQLEEKITANHIRECDQLMANEEVIVSLPKFRTDCHFNLKEVLGRIGIKNLFSQNADLSGMTGDKDLFVSEVIHQAFVDVNEEGTEAAAATAVVINTFCMPLAEMPPHFLADHPFLFFIQHCESGAILFAGRIVHPDSC